MADGNGLTRCVGALALAATLLGLPATPAMAQSKGYPDKPVKILVGYPPGGSADVMARLIADNLRDSLHQPVIVDNRSGASGNIAAIAAARAAPDGYTLLFGNPAEIVINKLSMKDMGFDPDTDFVPIVACSTFRWRSSFPPSRRTTRWRISSPTRSAIPAK